MKMKNKFTVEILRWNKTELKYAKEKKELEEGIPFSVCASEHHQGCKHQEEDIVLRNQQITGIGFYPNSKRLVLWTAKREGK